MGHCSCFFLVLVLAAAIAGCLAASEKASSEEEHVLQTYSSGTSSGLKQLPDRKPASVQLPGRKAGAVLHRRGARLKLRRKKRADREARTEVGKKDPESASEGLAQASSEPLLKRSDAVDEDDEANLQQAVEWALHSKQVQQQDDAAGNKASEEDVKPGSHDLPSSAGSKGASLEDGESGAHAGTANARAKAASRDSKAGIGTAKERGDSTVPTSITAVSGRKEADAVPSKDIAKADSQHVDSKASATASSAKGAAEPEAKPGPMDQMQPRGDRGGRKKSSEPLPHDGGTLEGREDPGDLDKEQFFPPLDTPGDEPYDSSRSAMTLGRNRAADSEAGDGVRPASKDVGDKAAGGGKKHGQHDSAGESQAGLDKEQSWDGAQSSREASKSFDKSAGDNPAAGKSALTAGRGNSGVEGEVKFGKVPGGGSGTGSAISGAGATSGGQPGGDSTSSDAKSGSKEGGDKGRSGERTAGGAGADMAKSDKEPSGNAGLRDAIALLQRGDVGDGVFELAIEDEEEDEETGGGGPTKGAAGKTKDRKNAKLQDHEKPASSGSSAKTADEVIMARPSRNEESSTDRKGKPWAERSEESGADSADQQKKAGVSKTKEKSSASADRKEETGADKPADKSRESGMDGQPEEEAGEEVRSAPRTFDRLLDHYKIASFLDVPCGDGDQVSSKVDHFPTSHPDDIRYIGVDDSEAAIDSAARVHGDTPNWSFHVQDYVHKSLPKADLLVSRAALLRPDMLTLVEMLENFARSGAKYLLLGSFEELTFADGSISAGTETGSGKESEQDEVESEGVPCFVSLQQEPFGLDAPLQVFSEPEGFGAKVGAAATSGSAAKSGESLKGGKVDNSDDDSKPGRNARSGKSAKAGEDASSEKTAASSGVKRQMLLYSGDYLMRQNFSLMRGRVELFLDAE